MGPLVYAAYYPGHACNWLLWVALVQVSIKDVLDKQHYSVDMVLAPVVTAAMWGWVKWVYPEDTPLRHRPPEAPADPLSPWVMALIVVGLTAAAVAIFIGKA
jgi:DNA mismatch repair protein MutS2